MNKMERRLILCFIAIVAMSTTCIVNARQEDRAAGFAMRELIRKADKEAVSMNTRLSSLDKYNDKTKKIAKDHGSKKTVALRKKILKMIATSNKYKKATKKYLLDAMTLAREGASIDLAIIRAEPKYKNAYKISR